MSDERLLVDFAQAAKMLGIGRSLLYQMSCDGRLGPLAIKIGRRSLLRVEELRAWTAEGLPPRTAWLKRRGGTR